MDKKNNTYCSVPQCTSRGKTHSGLSFHRFPEKGKGKVSISNKLGNQELLDRQQAWMLKLKIGKSITKYMLVCSTHFQVDDYFRDSKKLKKTAVPSQNLPQLSLETRSKPCTLTRASRLEKRRRLNEPSTSQTSDQDGVIHCEAEAAVNLPPTPEESKAAEALLQLLSNQSEYTGPTNMKDFATSTVTKTDFSVQVNVPERLTVCNLITNDNTLNVFTGLNNFKILNMIVELLQNQNIDQRLHVMSIRERVILTFIKLKHDLSYVLIGSLCGVSAQLCKTYIHSMLPNLAGVLKTFIQFPSSQEIQNNMPKCFQEFQDVRVILDCTEIQIQNPKCLCCRIRFYSQYKSSETIKFMVGVSPAGLVTYISAGYGGRASDKLIFEESDLILQLDKEKDALMVDKGFLIDDICESFKIKLIRPPFLKNQKQLSAEDAILNSKIASARVHVESVNQRLKIFKILGGKLQWSLVSLVDCIFTIICAVTNLSPPILSYERFLLE